MCSVEESSRRGFLKATATTAAGIVVAGGLNLARSAHAAGGDELKIALIGCGGRGTGAVTNCLSSVPNVKLWAMADAFASRLESSLTALSKEHRPANSDHKESEGFGVRIDVPPERRFVGFDAYKKAIASGADVVFLCTPPGFRPIHYAAAVAAGRHVFMEKPCCIDAPRISFLDRVQQGGR